MEFKTSKAVFPEEIILNFFDFMVNTEVRKRINDNSELREGQQQGYLQCMEDIIGVVSDSEFDEAFQQGKTLLQVIETIVDLKLADLVEDLSDRIEELELAILPIDDMNMINKRASKAVQEFAKKTPICSWKP